MDKCRVAVLASGFGSNLQALIDACEAGQLQAEIVAVITNKADAYALQRAEQAGIAHQCIANGDFADRISYDAALIEALDAHQPDLIVMAGFMRILTPQFIQHFAGRMLNIHPSLLPKYTGLNTHQRAIDAGEQEHGASIHFVTEELDGGPVILQAKVPVYPDDSADELAQRVHAQEHRIYPLVVSWFATGRLQMRGDTAVLDGTVLPAEGYAAD